MMMAVGNTDASDWIVAKTEMVGKKLFKEGMKRRRGMALMNGRRMRQEQGMKFVLENSPWMVGRRPLIVQQWSPDVNLEKAKPDKIPLWIKIDKQGEIIRTKKVKVEYSWRPDTCKHCRVFGHTFYQCSKRPRSDEEKRQDIERIQDKRTETEMVAQKRYKWNQQHNYMKGNQNVVGKDQNAKNQLGLKSVRGASKMEYMPVNVGNASKGKVYEKGMMEGKGNTIGETSDSKKITKPMVAITNMMWEKKVDGEETENCVDVLEEITGIGKCMEDNEVMGMEGYLQPTF
ncbi:RNA-directed DNA polymerase, eukaryota, reverse transcriptase zinc-binding domain protein [Tanacetum coccineum]